MRRRRVAVLEPIAHAGGAQISLLELVRELRDDPQIIVILPEDGPLHPLARAAGAEVCVLPWPPRLIKVGERSGSSTFSKRSGAVFAAFALPALSRRLAHLLDEIRADVLVTNGIKAHILGAISQFGSRRPLIWYLRDGLEGRPMSAWLMRLLARRCYGAIAISRFVKEETRKILPASVPVRVIYNLVDFSRFKPGAVFASDLKKIAGEVWFGIVGALTPLKGQDIFLQAASQVAAQLPTARFLVVGANFYRTETESTYEQSLRDLAATPPLKGRVTFLGQRTDVASILASLDVLVVSNRGPEALGRSILEAMACGVPVIGPNRWGPAELIQNGKTGLLTPVLDVSSLAEAMLILGRDKAKRVALAAAGLRWVQTEVEANKIVFQFRSFIDGFHQSLPCNG